MQADPPKPARKRKAQEKDGDEDTRHGASTSQGAQLSDRHAHQLAATLGLHAPHVSSVLRLLQEGCSVPFIARYRKEATGCMPDSQLRELVAAAGDLEKLVVRQAAISKALEEQGVSMRRQNTRSKQGPQPSAPARS
jgi:transcriptional accessory protein Tex/SPT6